jgi:hypothetical protein
MELTESQQATLKTHIQGDPVLALLPQSNQSALDIATALNVILPDYWVLKNELGEHEFTDQAGVAADGVTVTGFVWGGAQGGYIARSVQEQNAYSKMFNATGKCFPKFANVRTAIDDIFSGSGAGAVANRAHFRAMSRRLCRVSEKVLAIATVGGPVQTGIRGSKTNPDTLTAEGLLSYSEINVIMRWEV